MLTKSLAPLAEEDVLHTVSLVSAAMWSRLRGQRIFLTGGTGFVGKWLLATLIEADRTLDLGCEVVVLSRDPSAFQQQAPELANARGVRLVTGDVRSFTAPEGRFDRVVHAATDVVASSTPLEIFDACAAGTRRVLEFAVQSSARDFLLVSSGAIYGRQPPTLNRLPEDHPGAPDTRAPGTAYGQGKRAAEWQSHAFGTERGLRVVTARLFALVGPYLALDKRFAIGNFLRDALSGKPIVIEGDGTAYRSYLYAADMAAWLWTILFRGEAGAAYNVGHDEVISIRDLAHCIATATNSPSPVIVRGAPVPGRPAERYVPDVSKARDTLGLTSTFTLNEGIRRTADWCRAAAGA